MWWLRTTKQTTSSVLLHVQSGQASWQFHFFRWIFWFSWWWNRWECICCRRCSRCLVHADTPPTSLERHDTGKENSQFWSWLAAKLNLWWGLPQLLHQLHSRPPPPLPWLSGIRRPQPLPATTTTTTSPNLYSSTTTAVKQITVNFTTTTSYNHYHHWPTSTKPQSRKNITMYISAL